MTRERLTGSRIARSNKRGQTETEKETRKIVATQGGVMATVCAMMTIEEKSLEAANGQKAADGAVREAVKDPWTETNRGALSPARRQRTANEFEGRQD